MIDYRLPALRPRALAMFRRNLRVWRKLIGPAILMNFGEPMIYLFGLGLGLGFFINQISGMSYLAFLATGIMASSTMNSASFEGMYSVYTRMDPQRTYDALLATPLDIDDLIAGEMLWCGFKAMLSGTAILLVASVLGAVGDWNAALTIPVFFLAGLCFAGPAIVMSTLAPGYDFFQYYFTLVITPMLMLSGVFFPMSALPDVVQAIVYALPLPHVVELIRPLATGAWPDNALLNIVVIGLYSVAGFHAAVVFARRRFVA
ncbi:MAG: ABC transporter permease [Gammaproteobacteria bacterium]